MTKMILHIKLKGGKYLEALAQADTIVFDKTGTLTRATPQAVQVVPFSGCSTTAVSLSGTAASTGTVRGRAKSKAACFKRPCRFVLYFAGSGSFPRPHSATLTGRTYTPSAV